MIRKSMVKAHQMLTRPLAVFNKSTNVPPRTVGERSIQYLGG